MNKTQKALRVERALKLALEPVMSVYITKDGIEDWWHKLPEGRHELSDITAIRSVLNEHGEALAQSLRDEEQPAKCKHNVFAPYRCTQCEAEQPAIKQDLTPEQPSNHYDDVRESMRQAFEQPAPAPEVRKQQSAERVEPVAWMDAEGDVYKTEPPEGWCPPHTPLYTSPPYEATPLASQRSVKPWRGLTDKDLAGCDDEEFKQARYWEQVLREKNT